MDREIKFRAYHIQSKKMIYQYCGWEFDTEYDTLNFPFPVLPISGDDKEYILMQFTGIKDKNGKEIYEGDVIMSKGNVVEFSFGGFNINGDVPLVVIAHKNIILGNIYENPELLKII